MSDEELTERLAAVLDDTATGLWMGQEGPGWGRVIAGILLPEVKHYAAIDPAHTDPRVCRAAMDLTARAVALTAGEQR